MILLIILHGILLIVIVLCHGTIIEISLLKENKNMSIGSVLVVWFVSFILLVGNTFLIKLNYLIFKTSFNLYLVLVLTLITILISSPSIQKLFRK